MNVEELLTDTFAAHEHLAPDPASLLRELANRRRHRLRARMAMGGTVVAIAAVAAGGTIAAQSAESHRHRLATVVDPSEGSAFTFVSATAIGTLIPQADRHSASDFSGALLNGGTYSLRPQRGKVVVVNFWATWCVPCVAETPQFDAVYRQYKSESVTFVGVDTKDETSHANAFIADKDIGYPIIFDPQARTAHTLGKIPATWLPFTVLIDRRGRVAAVYMRAVAPKDLTKSITALLAEK
jgi:peroxiredoxin